MQRVYQIFPNNTLSIPTLPSYFRIIELLSGCGHIMLTKIQIRGRCSIVRTCKYLFGKFFVRAVPKKKGEKRSAGDRHFHHQFWRVWHAVTLKMNILWWILLRYARITPCLAKLIQKRIHTRGIQYLVATGWDKVKTTKKTTHYPL